LLQKVVLVGISMRSYKMKYEKLKNAHLSSNISIFKKLWRFFVLVVAIFDIFWPLFSLVIFNEWWNDFLCLFVEI